MQWRGILVAKAFIGFVFNILSLLFMFLDLYLISGHFYSVCFVSILMFRFYSIFYDLYSVSIHFYCITFSFILYIQSFVFYLRSFRLYNCRFYLTWSFCIE